MRVGDENGRLKSGEVRCGVGLRLWIRGGVIKCVSVDEGRAD